MTTKEALLTSATGLITFLAILFWGTSGCIAFVLLALITLFGKRKILNPEEKLSFYKTTTTSSILTLAFLFVLFYLQDKSLTIVSPVAIKDIWIFLALAFLLIIQGALSAIANKKAQTT